MKVVQLELPTPYPVGPVNVWLLKGDACVLIDTGPLTEPSRRALERGLRKARVGWKDIDAILLTHGHPDHFGLADELRRRTSAPVYAHPEERRYVADYPDSYWRSVGRYERISLQHGFPREEFQRIWSGYHETVGIGEAVRVERTVRDGGVLEFGSIRLEAVHTPGHTTGSLCYLDSKEGQLFCGDTILERITPVTFFKRGRVKTGPVYYERSLDRLAALEVRLAHPGHQRSFRDFTGAVRRIRRHLERRAARVLEALDRPKTAHDLAEKAFPARLPGSEWLTFAETVGILEHLERHGRVVRKDHRPVTFSRT